MRLNPLSLCCLLLLAACGPLEEPPTEIDLTRVGKADLIRQASVTLSPGSTRRFRIKATGFHAELSQTTAVMARLSAKHYDIDVQGQASLAPALEVVGDGTLRNWTLRVSNEGADSLEGTLTVSSLATPAAEEPGIICDIDKTLLPPKTASAPMPPPYPGVAKLMQLLELGDGSGQPGDMYFVTSRSPDRVVEIPAWLQTHGIPSGPIETGVSTLPWVAQPEKVKDISKIMDASPQQSFVLFGDSSHRDPEVYREVIQKYGSRVLAGVIHKVNNPNPTRLQGLHLVVSYAEAAAVLYGLKVLDEAAAREVMKAAQTEGLAITNAEIDALIAAHAPDPPSPPDPPDPPDPPPSAPFHGNTSSKSFHAPGCPYYSCASCTAVFPTREDAIQAGYHPCGICKP